MPPAPEGTAAPEVVSSAPSLESYVGEAFGDFSSSGGEQPAPDAHAAGKTPAAPAAGPADGTKSDAGPDGAEGDASAALAENTSAEAAPDTPDEPDPFATAKPLTYTVDGEAREFPEIRVLGEHGAVIEASALPKLQDRLAQADRLFATNRQQQQALHTFDRLTEWTATGRDGKEQTFKGVSGLLEMRVANAALAAENAQLAKALTDPAQLASIVVAEVGPDGKQTGRIIADPRELQRLITSIENMELKSAQAIRDHYRSVQAEVNRPAADSTDFAAVAPAIIQQAAGADFPKLSDKSRAFLASQMPRYVRAATPDERRANPNQMQIVDASFAELVKDQLDRVATTAAIAKTSADAAKTTSARMLAAAAGVRKQPAKGTTRPIPSTDTREQAEGDAWDRYENAAARAIRHAS